MENTIENRCLQHLKIFATLSQMGFDSLYYLKKQETENPERKEHYQKIEEEIVEFIKMFLEDDSPEPKTYEECQQEYDALLNLTRCSTRALDLLEISSETYLGKVEEYWQVYREYSKKLEEKVYRLYGKKLSI